MAAYLSVPLEGLGTIEVECLSTYLARIGRIHGVSPYQFVRHLHGWWARENPTDPAVPEYIITSGVTAVCGSGQDTKKLVEILTIATDVPGLRAGTLLFLGNVISNSGRLAIKSHRAWCPACMSEAAHRKVTVYDRLLWRLRNITRCPIHQLELVTACPGCRRKQTRYSGSGDLTCCHLCDATLIPEPGNWRHESRPAFGERDLMELLMISSRQPDKVFDPDAYTSFCAAVDYRGTRRARTWDEVEFRKLTHSLRGRFRPTVHHLLKAAAVVNVPLALMLEEPRAAASVAAVPLQQLWPCKLPMYDKPWYPPERRQATGRALRLALADTQHHAPADPREVAQSQDVSDAAARRWFPVLYGALEALYRRERMAERNRLSLQVIRAFLDDGLLSAYQNGTIPSQDVLMRRVARLTGASIHQARVAYNELMGTTRR